MSKVFLHDQNRKGDAKKEYGARLTVMCSSGLIVKAICGDTEYATVADTSNKAVFNGLHNGVWEISLNDANTIAYKTIEIVSDYEVVIDFFTATVVIDYPEGSVCSCTNGIITYTAPDTSGLWYCVVSDTGQWIISCTDGEYVKSKTIEVAPSDTYVDVKLSYFTATIDVTYPKAAICSCSNGDTLYSASNTSGNWSFTVYEAGDWTITATDGIQTVSTVVNVNYDGQVESATIKFFVSTIDITYPESASCTCTDGITTFIAPDTSGRWTVNVPRIGVWTITSYNGNQDVTQTVDITYDGQAESVVLEFFIAYINVTYPAGTLKVVLLCTNEYGVKEDVAVDTSGSGFKCFNVERVGSYEVAIYRVAPYVGIESVTSDYASATVTITEDKQTIDVALIYKSVPDFTYTGTYKLVDDTNNPLSADARCDWNIAFLTTGYLTFTNLNDAAKGIDVFVLGGGGKSGESCQYHSSSSGEYRCSGGGGGGGGYRTSEFGVQVSAEKQYPIVIGGSGGSSSGFEVSANGGSQGGTASKDAGGAGGAGGSAGCKGGHKDGKADNGTNGSRAFNASVGYLYGGGGGGGYGFHGGTNTEGTRGEGGKDGGAKGGYAAAANTGGGAGGENSVEHWGNGLYDGGSGIVIIRNKRA
jgi:hypothetical protein